ncbi:hypothetical protein ACQP1W_52450 (plasmid) [Spirillospora sp. CA-255316]
MQIDVPEPLWGIIFGVAVLAVVLWGFPFLLGGGGQLGRRRRGGRGGRRGGYRVRVGPHPALVVLRHADTLLLGAATAVFVVAVIVNAGA